MGHVEQFILHEAVKIALLDETFWTRYPMRADLSTNLAEDRRSPSYGLPSSTVDPDFFQSY